MFVFMNEIFFLNNIKNVGNNFFTYEPNDFQFLRWNTFIHFKFSGKHPFKMPIFVLVLRSLSIFSSSSF